MTLFAAVVFAVAAAAPQPLDVTPPSQLYLAQARERQYREAFEEVSAHLEWAVQFGDIDRARSQLASSWAYKRGEMTAQLEVFIRLLRLLTSPGPVVPEPPPDAGHDGELARTLKLRLAEIERRLEPGARAGNPAVLRLEKELLRDLYVAQLEQDALGRQATEDRAQAAQVPEEMRRERDAIRARMEELVERSRGEAVREDAYFGGLDGHLRQREAAGGKRRTR